jgi:hypothetical protein
VTYDGVYYLFVGLFSKNPNNVLNTNYTDLRGELLEEFLGQDPGGEATFNTLFMLHKRAGAGMTSIENTYDDEDGSYRPLFQRFSKESKPDYQAFLTILAACSCVKRNIYQAPWGFSEMSSFLSAIRNILDNDPDRFIRHCRYAFEAIALTLLESEKTGNTILQEMYSEIRRSKFENLYRKVRLIADGHESHR